MSVPCSLRNDILLFVDPPSQFPSTPPRTSTLGFRTRPLTEHHVKQNNALWRAVQSGSLTKTDAEILHVAQVHALAIPRPLFVWLMKYSWQEVSHAILCILHDATCCAPNWHPSLPCPATLAPSVATSLAQLKPHCTHCRRGDTTGTPLVTNASNELDDLLQYFAGELLWTVPVRPIIPFGQEDTFVALLVPQWTRWKRVGGEGGHVTIRFMDVILEGQLRNFWNTVDTVLELGNVSTRTTTHGATFLQLLPADVITEHVVPRLFNAK